MITDSALEASADEVVNPEHGPTMRYAGRVRQAVKRPSCPLVAQDCRAPHAAMSLLDRIHSRMSALGLSAEGASKKAGLGREFVRNLERRPDIKPRGDSLAAMARALEVSVDWLLELTDDPTPPPGVRDVSAPPFQSDATGPLPLIGVAQAGAWLDLDDGAPIPSQSHVLPDKRFPRGAQYALRLQGDSIDLVYPAGAELRVIRAAAIGYAPRRGDLVIVERRRAGLREASAKFVGGSGAKIALAGRSSDARWNQALDLAAPGEDVTVEIIGLVTGAFVPPPAD